MTGYLTESLSNLVVSEKSIEVISGLPADAKNLQSDSINILKPLIEEIKGVQKTTSAFVKEGTINLNKLEVMIQKKEGLTTLKKFMNSIRNSAKKIQPIINDASIHIKSASSNVTNNYSHLSSLKIKMIAKQSSYEAERDSYESELSEQKKKYLIYSIIATLGIIGLGVGAAEIVKLDNRINSTKGQIRKEKKELANVRSLLTVLDRLMSDLRDTVNRITSIKNSIDFLISDLLKVRDDLDEQKSLLAVKILSKAATAEMKTVELDIS